MKKLTAGVLSLVLSSSFVVAHAQQTKPGDTLKTQEIETVVVTALGIKREKKALGYSSQSLDAEKVNSVPTNNFINNLSGKVAGMEIKNNGNFGGSSNIVLRGTKSLTGDNQALIVLDGVPIVSGNLNSGDASKGRDGFDFGNATSDIDPNNIESINVLKGAAATALYGSLASNGAVIITTKKGKKSKSLGLTINSTVSVGEIDRSTFPKYQKLYGAGYSGADSFFNEDVNGDGIIDILAPTGDDASYGAAFDPNLMVYQWNSFVPGNPNFGKATPWTAARNDPSKFFQKSLSFVNSFNLNGGDELNTYNLTFSNNYETGILPNSRLNKNMLSGNYSRKFSDKLTARTSLTFNDQTTVGRNSVGYGDNIMTGFRQWWPINVDVLELRDEFFRTGQNYTWNMNAPLEGDLSAAFWNNPYWDRYKNYSSDDKTRLIAGGELSYDVTDKFNILGRATIDYTNSKQELRKAVGSHAEEFGLAQADETSGYWVYDDTIMRQTYDIIGRYNLNISDKVNALFIAGGQFMDQHQRSIENSTTGGLIIPNLYTIGNSRAYFPPLETNIRGQKAGIYAQASFDYNKFLFLEGTIRNDTSSALPKVNNNYTYYSLGSSFVFSELVKPSWLNFGKVRLSYAEVGKDTDFGRPGFFFNRGTVSNNPMADISNTYVDFNSLKPERQKSWEVGLETSMFKRRVTLDVSLYKTNTEDLLFSVPQSPSTKYSFSLINAGETENKGIEVALGAVPLKSENFQWDINVNWSRNRNIVKALNQGRDNLQLASFQETSLNATVGEAYGTFRGTGFVYDANGNKVVDDDGYYLVATDKVIGNIQPDWIGGVYNTFRYKNISLGFLIDVRKGGSVYSLDQSYGGYTGIYEYTAGLNDLGNPIRNTLDNGGGIVLSGVKQDGTPNNVRIDASTAGGAFGTDAGLPQEAFVYDASYVKLREAKISYSLPADLLRNTFIKGMTLSLMGQNLWIIHKNLPDADPEAGTSSGNVQGFQSGVMPTTRIYSFNVKLDF
ncbi:SusC/RagA family TonB-linked outer membrane protein [Chryseobacterium balustinum]|uniref:Enterobactin outer-membrane receptor n=1 Tax=Chryseobacterium balustinum TaxID=246 RepID=A0AAX2IJ93_9FLAO|nr:SusC/RagA family TonB-linked outer membrane protein [Chryseobacterium balustinum]AZB30687.1 SusC/RagA family TonB-linked outer membrane protein [Chryseobacterium balustinum]SKB98138.1 TonB-linked outer membrane protein, SusC/RagA family [Chryseobacterium balustinum]SQA88884.1 Enterobactin outer-membrane receptor [Chryseobacterium balustinum]